MRHEAQRHAIGAEPASMERRLAECEDYVKQASQWDGPMNNRRRGMLKRQIEKHRAAAARLRIEIADWHRTHSGHIH